MVLSKKTRQGINLVTMGTFLEYFDLMLYVHMASFLNQIFFSKEFQDSQFIAAFAFCSTFLLKPVGGFLIGFFGDKYGRKSVLIFCTFLMALCSITIANLKSFEEIGFYASVIVTICRFLQGLSSIGEATSSEIYVFEQVSLPEKYFKTALVSYSGVVGMAAALLVAKIVMNYQYDWRIIFWIGGGIAIVGYVVRVQLAESDEFLDARRKLLKHTDIALDDKTISNKRIRQFLDAKVETKTIIAYFCSFCGWPICFYLGYIYFGTILKKMGLSQVEIINQNFKLAIANLIGLFFWIYLTKFIHPLKIIMFKLSIFIIFIIALPFLLTEATNHTHILLIQIITIVFGSSTIIGRGVFLKYFPTLQRFKQSALYNGLSHVIVYFISSAGISVVVKYMDYYGLWFITIPFTLLFLYGIQQYIKLEKKTGDYFIFDKK